MPKANAPTLAASTLLNVPLTERLLAAAMERGADFAEVFVERTETTSVVLEEEKVKSAQSGLAQGVGIRVLSGAKAGYAYSDDFDEEALFRAAKTAALIARGGGSESAFKVSRAPSPTFYRLDEHLSSIALAKKRDLVLRANKAARAFDKRVRQVNAAYSDSTKRIMVANTRGHLAEDTQDLSRLSVQVVVEGKKG